ncbi:MAG: hypothetical protein MUF70_15220 [Myxococcota bacterium]|nr:hypothetical protein [Myxococcota bacterium]
MRIAAALALLCLSAAGDLAHAQDADLIGGRTQTVWREEMAALERAVERAEAALAACEEREAPAAYDGIDAVITQDRRGRLRGVAITRCDEERLDQDESRAAVEDFEESARRSGVPPGWLR